MDIGAQALSDYIFHSKYARNINGRKETWEEACDRVLNMHRKFYGYRLDRLQFDFAQAEQALKQKRVLGSQRNMQYGGEPVLRKHERSYNCAAHYIDRPRAFAETLFLLLCGCGVGFSVQKHHVAKLPDLPIWKCNPTPVVHTVEDSIEGWALALDALMNSYFQDSGEVTFVYDLVRPEGSPLSSGAGVAPGPEPLRIALEKIRAILETCRGRKLRPIEAYDILMHAAGAVLSGGVRRSATLALFSHDDEEMLTAKSGDWFETNPQRAYSNNSAALLRTVTTPEEFHRFVMVAKQSGGEPGFVWLDSLEFVPNPCVEVLFFPQIRGLSGVQFCNLSSINAMVCYTDADFFQACEDAAFLGTLQAGYTDFPFLGPISEEITRREALIGVSINGLQDQPWLLKDTQTLSRGMEIIKHTNAYTASQIGIFSAARCGSEKPEGTSSGLLGCASGKHARPFYEGLRHVQANPNEPAAKEFARVNPGHVEPSVWREGDLVLTFPIRSPEGSRLRSEETAISQLEDVVTLQRAWIEPGKRIDRCAHVKLQNSVSNTVSVRPDEWEQAIAYIYCHRESFSGVSLLPYSGDLDYPQAPFVSIDEDERIELQDQWMRLRSTLRPVDYSGTEAGAVRLEPACSGGACEI